MGRELWAGCLGRHLAVYHARCSVSFPPHLVGFDGKGYTNPSMMFKALDSVGVEWGLASPPRMARLWAGAYPVARAMDARGCACAGRRYRHTHWVGTNDASVGRGVFDMQLHATMAAHLASAFKIWSQRLWCLAVTRRVR